MPAHDPHRETQSIRTAMLGPALTTDLLQPHTCPLHTRTPPHSRARVHCRAHASQRAAQESQPEAVQEGSRRGLLAASAALALLSSVPQADAAPDLVQYKPDGQKTPSLRSGVIPKTDSYTFSIPPSWKEQKIANIQSGNFCMPRCDEPWTEAVFADTAQGKCQLLVSPLRRLISKANATLEQIGSPNKLLDSIGPFITGVGGLDEEEILSADSKKVDGRTFYTYEVNSLSATNGPHSLTALTTKGDLAYLFTVSASDKQWSKSKDTLRKIVGSFSV